MIAVYLLAWGMGLFFTLVKGASLAFLGLEFFDLDLLLILTACLLLFFGPVAAGVFALGQGLLVDIFSGGMQGLFASLYLSAFGGIYLGSRFFDLLEPKGQALLVSLAFLLKNTLFFILLGIFSVEAVFSRSILWMSGLSLIGTGLITPVIFCLADHLRTALLADVGDGLPEELELFFHFPSLHAEPHEEKGHQK